MRMTPSLFILACEELETILNARKRNNAAIDAAGITFTQGSDINDPTKTTSAKTGASVNYTARSNFPNNRNMSNS